MHQIHLTNEIASSYLSDYLLESEYDSLLNHPENYLKSQFDLDINAEITIVQNQPNLINLALPYYSGLEDISAEAVSPHQMESVAGGEIVGYVIFGVGVSVLAIAVTASLTTAFAVRNAQAGKNLDGSPK